MWRHLVGRFRTNAGNVIWPKLEPMECLTWIFLPSEFACFVAGEIIQVIEAMPGSVVPLAMFDKHMAHLHYIFKFGHEMLSLTYSDKNWSNLHHHHPGYWLRNLSYLSSLELMQVAPSCDQIWYKCMWRPLPTKFGTNASGAIRWPNLELMQVVPSGDQIWN